jgi:thioredoxin-like negative regulator of GroEL
MEGLSWLDDEVRRLLRRKARALAEEAGRCCRGGGEGVVEINYPEELRDFIRSCRVAFVFFYTPTCPFCKALMPLYEEAAAYYAGRAGFARLNLARMPFISDALGIMGTPTIIVFVNGREAGRIVGMVDGAQLEEVIERALRAAGCGEQA